MRNKFDEQLDHLNDEMVEMGNLCEQVISGAINITIAIITTVNIAVNVFKLSIIVFSSFVDIYLFTICFKFYCSFYNVI